MYGIKSTLLRVVSAGSEPHDRRDDRPPSPVLLCPAHRPGGVHCTIKNVLDFQRLELLLKSLQQTAFLNLGRGPNFLNFPTGALKRQVRMTLASPQPFH